MSRYTTLTQLTQNLVLESDMSASEIARAVGKPYPTLMRELNPYDTGAKLGAETLLEILKATGNMKPLEYMAGELGYRVVPE